MGQAAAIGTSLFGAGFSAYANYKAGRAQQNIANANADNLDWNAGVSDLQADDALSRGRETEGIQRKQVKGLIGSQRAGFAAQGVDVGSGSAVDVQADAAYLGELDALTIRTNAAREAWGYKVQAEDYRAQARSTRAGGQLSAAEGKNRAIGTFLNAGADLVYQKYGFAKNNPKSKT